MAIFITNPAFKRAMTKSINKSKSRGDYEKAHDKSPFERLEHRMNVTNRTRMVVTHLIASLAEECPSSKGLMYGIKYQINYNGSAVISLGGPLLPYIIHLGYPATKRATAHSGWVERAIDKSRDYISSEGFILNEPVVGYGMAQLVLEEFKL